MISVHSIAAASISVALILRVSSSYRLQRLDIRTPVQHSLSGRSERVDVGAWVQQHTCGLVLAVDRREHQRRLPAAADPRVGAEEGVGE